MIKIEISPSLKALKMKLNRYFLVLFVVPSLIYCEDTGEDLIDENASEKTGEHATPSQEAKEGTKKDNKSPHKLTGSLTFVSDYRSRGISQTILQPAVQGELKYSHNSGFYVRLWGSNVGGTPTFLNNIVV